MPKKYGVKEKDPVVAHIVNLILTGRLRTGDRVDRNEIAVELGLSRVPIQEAVVQLEHDGILSTRYHRGAFVERFDEAIVLEHLEVYGLLNGLASARAAANPTARILDQLETLLGVLRTAQDAAIFHQAGCDFRRAINDEYAGPRLRAMIDGSQSFLPRQFWFTYQNSQDAMLRLYEAEVDAIRRRDPDAAKAVSVARADLLAEIMLDELVRRSVLGDARSS